MWNSETFIHAMESYYGKYRSGVRKVLVEYLKTLPVEQLPKIRHELIMTVSTRYGHVPDVATIEEAVKEMRKNAGVPDYRAKQLPDPTAKSMKIEVGEMFKRVLSKVSERRKRENAEWLTYDGG